MGVKEKVIELEVLEERKKRYAQLIANDLACTHVRINEQSRRIGGKDVF